MTWFITPASPPVEKWWTLWVWMEITTIPCQSEHSPDPHTEMSKNAYKYFTIIYDLPSHMFGSENRGQFQIWKIILAKAIHYQNKRNVPEMCIHPDLLKQIWETPLYTRPDTAINADGVPKLQHYQDTYISLCTKRIGCKKAIKTTHHIALKFSIIYD